MRRFPDLRVGQWLAISFAASAILLVVVGGLALSLLRRVSEAERDRAVVVVPRAAAAADLERQVLRLSISVRTYVLMPDRARREAFEQARARVEKAVATLDAMPKSPEGQVLWRKAVEKVDAYRADAARFSEDVRAPREELRAAEVPLTEAREAALAAVAEYRAMQDRKAAAAGATIQSLQRRAEALLAIAAAVALALLALTAVIVGRALRGPTRALVTAARELSEGRYDHAATFAGRPEDPLPRNELSELRRVFGRMALAIRDREERIVSQNQELQAQQEELQAQQEELQAQQEELQAQNEELQSLNEELHAQQDELKSQAERLRETDRQKSEFLAVLSHELRNPLAPIVTALQTLDRAGPGSDEARRARAVMARQAQHLVRLVDDLLDATRVNQGKIQLRRTHVDLTQLVRQVVDDGAPAFASRGVEVEVDVPADRPLWIDADPARVTQIVGNLLQNASKFTPAGGRVRVALDDDGGRRAVLRIRDTGVGITPDVLPQLFRPFVQAERSLARSQGGLGLGLALVKGLVEMHGGTVRASSDGEGQGSEFTVEFPLDGAPPGAREMPIRTAPPPRRVIVVEDNVDAAETLADLLRLRGNEVEVAYDGAAGLARVRESKPDVVLCDIGLPTLDGYMVARAVRSDPALASVRLVALTGYAQAEDVRRAREAGFDAHLTKPARAEELEEVLGIPRAC